MKKIGFRKIKSSTGGAAGVVVTLLVIGLMISALALVQTVFVPKWMSQKEADHMEEVSNQFSQIKFAIDTLSVVGQENTQISSPITLGCRETPYLKASRAYGSLNIDPNEGKIIFRNIIGDEVKYDLGNIEYKSSNGYFLNQNYIYENGAILLNQDEGDVISSKPGFIIDSSGDFFFNLVRLVPGAEKTSASGFGTYPVQSMFSNSKTNNIYKSKDMTILSSCPSAWKSYFDDTLSYHNIGFSINDETDSGGEIIGFTIEFHNPPDISIKMSEIDVQISPGWIE